MEIRQSLCQTGAWLVVTTWTFFPPKCRTNLCDPIIDICVSEIIRDKCDYLHQRTYTYTNTDHIDFVNTEFNFSIPYWGGAIRIKLDVGDAGTGLLEPMATLRMSHSLSTPADFGTKDWKPLTFSSGGVQVEMEVNVMCDKGFRDRSCTCQDIDVANVEHTMCDRDSNRVCLAGWAQTPKCLTSTKTCVVSDPCKHNSTCGTYNKAGAEQIVCTCLLDYSGKYCEIYTAPTTPSTTPLPTTTTSPRLLSTITSTTNTTAPKTTATKNTTTTVDTATTVSTLTTTTPTKTITTTPASTKSRVVSATTMTAPNSNPTTTMTTTTTTTMTMKPVPKGMTTLAPDAKPSSGSDSGGNTAAIGGGVGAALSLAAALCCLFLMRKRIFKGRQAKVADVEREPIEDIKPNEDTQPTEDIKPTEQSEPTSNQQVAKEDAAIDPEDFTIG